MRLLLSGIIAYMLGSMSFGIIVSKLSHNDDIRRHGSGNAGMTNAMRVYGAKTAVWVFLGDFIKGALSVYIGGKLAPGGELVGALMAVVGHIFPLFFSMRGGKGVATAAGAVLVLSPVTLAILAVPFAVLLLTTRYMSLASVTVAVLFPVVTVVRLLLGGEVAGGWAQAAVALVIGGLVTYMHRSNIARLLAGTESKVGQKKK